MLTSWEVEAQGLAFLPQRTGKHTVGELSWEEGWHSLRLLMNLTGRTTLPSPALQGNLHADKSSVPPEEGCFPGV